MCLSLRLELITSCKAPQRPIVHDEDFKMTFKWMPYPSMWDLPNTGRFRCLSRSLTLSRLVCALICCKFAAECFAWLWERFMCLKHQSRVMKWWKMFHSNGWHTLEIQIFHAWLMTTIPNVKISTEWEKSAKSIYIYMNIIIILVLFLSYATLEQLHTNAY